MNKSFPPVHPIPNTARSANRWDMFATWIGANANNGTWYIGGVIAAAGMYTASTTLIIVGVLSYILLALTSIMGYNTGLPTMVLTRASFGIRGSALPSLINIIQFVGWAASNTFIAAISVSTIFQTIFGWPKFGQPGGQWGIIIGIGIMSILHILSISLGEKSVRLIERIGIILVIILVAWESMVIFKTISLHALFSWQPPTNIKISSGATVDILAAFNLAWVTAAADFSRFSKTKSGATTLSFFGASLGLFWFAFIGLAATIATAVTLQHFDPNNSDPSTIAIKLGLGILALLVIIITSTTANAVNLMAAGTALTNLYHKINLKPALWIVTLLATVVSFIPLIAANFLTTFTAFLDFIGMMLGPEIAIFLIDYYLIQHNNYQIAEFSKINGQYWYQNGINWRAFAAWVVGLISYWGLGYIAFIKESIGATFVAMLISAVLYYLLSMNQKSK
ncbi:cytosine permease [Weissella kandleri]|uniref:cytosine permease n=1 Tax=Weissella kandleri TaxID=1616 RepID=UPI00387ECD05